MAIITTPFETLVYANGEDRCKQYTMKTLTEQAKEIESRWKDSIVDNTASTNFAIDDAMQLCYVDQSGSQKKADISDTAFAQLCARVGVPARYIQKCMETGKTDLALENFKAWSEDCDSNMLVREHDGVVRAVMSDSYTPFDSYKIIKALQYTVDTERFIPTELHLSVDRFHARFVDFTPLKIEGETSPMYAGFTVDSSDVGRAALSVRFFLYRFACRNGMVIAKRGGMLYRQTHAGEKMRENKISVFNRAFQDMDYLIGEASDMIRTTQKQSLHDYELKMYIEKARRELKLSAKAAENLNGMIGAVYPQTAWGFMNAVTELSHEFTLDTRIEMESWAGDMLTALAR